MSSLNNISQDFFDNINNFTSNPFILVVLIGIILVYYLLFAFLRSSNSSGGGSGVLFIEALLWGLFILLIFVNGISYFYGVNVITEMKSIFSGEPEIQIETTVTNPNIQKIVKLQY